MRTKYFIIVLALALLLIFVKRVFGASGYTLSTKVVVTGSFSSNHANNCDPDCAVQKNDGQGFQIGPVGYYRIRNSFGNPGTILFIELEKLEVQHSGFKFDIMIWLMEITGYKETTEDENGVIKESDIIIRTPPWPVFEVGFNPYRFLIATGGIRNNQFKGLSNLILKDSWINFTRVYFPGVSIEWFTLEYRYKFKGVFK